MAASQSSTSSEELPRKRFFLRRVFISTWLMMLVTCGVLFLLEVPGRRTGLTTYEHGWPLGFLQCDYRLVAMTREDGSRIPAASAMSDSQYLEEMKPNWERDGLPWDLESRFSPWSLADATSFSTLHCVADLVIAGLVVLTVGWTWQRRRRIRGNWLQFRLRTLLAGVALLGIVFAQIKSWIVDCRTDEETWGKFDSSLSRLTINVASSPNRIRIEPQAVEATRHSLGQPSLEEGQRRKEIAEIVQRCVLFAVPFVEPEQESRRVRIKQFRGKSD